MEPLEEKKEKIRGLAGEMNAGGLTYTAVNVRLDMATSDLLGTYIIDTPDEIIDTVFDAYAEIHVLAAQRGQLTNAEASHLINDRAVELFEDYRGWEVVEQKVKPFWDRLDQESMGTEGPPINAL